MVVAATVSCREETTERGGSDIGFRTLVTRGDAVDDAADVASGGGFRVWGYRHPDSWPTASYTTLFDGTLVTSGDNGATWNYSGVYGVWPTGDRVSFFAYAPADVAGTAIDNAMAVPEVGFTVAADPASQADLLIANQMLDRVGPDPVQVVFEHALSRIVFLASKTTETAGAIRVTSLELRNIKYTGSTPLLTPVVWAVDDAKTDYALSAEDGHLEDMALDTTWQPLSTSAGTMFLMPQTLDAATVLVVRFRYENHPDIRELISELNLPEVSPTWTAGKPYTYRLLFDGEEIVIIGATLQPADPDGEWGEY